MNDRMKTDLPLDLDPELDEAAKLLNETAQHIKPSPAFQAALQRRLMASHAAQGDSAMFSLKKFAPAVFWVMAALVLVFVLDWAIRSVAPQPVPASRSTPVATLNAPAPPVVQPTAVPSGKTYDWRGTTLTISAAMPASPSEASVYPVPAERHSTVDQAIALARRFDIQGEAYQSQGELPGTTDYAVTDGKQFLRVRSSGYFTYTADVIKSYNDFSAITNPDAESIIAAFLTSHGFTFPYRMEWSAFRSAYAVEPLAPDGVPFGYEPFSASMLLITLDESGQVASVQASLLDVSAAPVGSYGILSADEALKRLLDPNASNGILGSTNSTMGPIQEWKRAYPTDQTLTIYGNVDSIQSVQPDKPAFIQIDGVPVTGQVTGLAEFSQPTYVEATGRFVTENGIEKFSVDSWKISPAQEDGLVGTLKRENGLTVLTADDGSTHTLPDVPAGVPMPFEKAFVVGTQTGELFQWKFIDNRMAAGGGGGGGGGGGAGFYKLNLSGTPVAFPTPTQAAGGGQYVVQAGDTLGSIAQSIGTTTDALIRANGLQDPNQLAIGQTILVPNAAVRPVEALRGVLNITISKLPDGTQSIAYGFLANASSDPGGYMLLEGTGLDSLQAYNSRPVDVWGSFRASPDGGIPTLKVDRFEIPFPDLKVQVLKGKQKLVEISGQPATLFTSDDGTAYVQLLGDATTGSSLIGVAGDEVQLECVSIPGEALGGYPALRVFAAMLAVDPKSGLHANLPITADKPAVVDIPFVGKTADIPTADIEKIELVYFTPDPRYLVKTPDAQPAYFQPAWRFTGHYSNGHEFEILIQALKDEYLLPEIEPGVQPG